MGESLTGMENQRAMTASNLLARELLTRANGVFLWVCLAIKTLLHGNQNHYSTKLLQQNIRKLPGELDVLFDQMLHGIRFEDRQLSAKLLLLATSQRYEKHRDGLTLLMISFIDQLDDPEFPFSSPISKMSDVEIEEKLEIGRCRLQSLTMGLFECPSSHKKSTYWRHQDHIYRETISALHSTVL